MGHRVAPLLLLLAGGCVGEPSAPPPPVVLGLVAPLTGPEASYGIAAKSGIELAVREANARGGVLGRTIQLAYLDDQGRPDVAEEAAQRLIVRDKVVVLLGEVSSGAARAVAAVAERAQVPMLTPSATTPDLTRMGRHVFRSCFADPLQAEVMGRFARQHLKLESVAVVRDLGSDYSQVLAEAFERAFTAAGGKIAAREVYGRDDPDDLGLSARLGASGAQAVYLPAYHREVARIAAAARAAGFAGVFLGSDGWDARSLWARAEALEGAYFTSHFAPDDPSPEVRAFVAAFRQEMNEAPDAVAALGYDAARLALEAIRAARSSDRAAVRDALAKIRRYPGATGTLTFDAEGDPEKDAVVLKIEAGAPRLVSRAR